MVKFRILPLLAVVSAAAVPASADVVLPALLSNHAVLQKSAKTRVWGKADPGEQIAVTLGAATAQAVAGVGGQWSAELNLSESKPGPFELVVQGKNRVAVSDVAVGEVWVASGQSNMEFLLRSTLGAKEEIAGSANPMLRQFLVKKAVSSQPLDDCQGAWTVAAPETSGEFTAVGYHFGKKLQRELQTAVGLLHGSWGGTPVEAWTSAGAIAAVPELEASRERIQKTYDDYPADREAYFPRMEQWLKETGRALPPDADPAPFAAQSVPPEGWATVAAPVAWKDAGLPESGVVWLRKEIDIAREDAKAPLRVTLGFIPGFETVYWDGGLVAESDFRNTEGANALHRADIPPQQTAEGRHLLAVRLHFPLPWISINPNLKLGNRTVSGPWQVKTETAYPALTPPQQAALPKAPMVRLREAYLPTMLYGGMLHPLMAYSIRGAIWYQGEANAGRAWQYRTAFPAMIRDWRQGWNQGDFPFYFCQLANYDNKSARPGDSSLAELREAQSKALELPNTGMAVLIDLGEVDIHPRNKKDVGERLAAIALARDYGKAVPYEGPLYDSMSVEGGKVRLRFKHAEGGLEARPVPAVHTIRSGEKLTAPLVRNSPHGELEGFALCGEDKKWVWADAKADGDTVLVWSDQVPAPVAVRYGWVANPTCNLYNKAGLPASPFRTDDFPAVTRDAK